MNLHLDIDNCECMSVLTMDMEEPITSIYSVTAESVEEDATVNTEKGIVLSTTTTTEMQKGKKVTTTIVVEDVTLEEIEETKKMEAEAAQVDDRPTLSRGRRSSRALVGGVLRSLSRSLSRATSFRSRSVSRSKSFKKEKKTKKDKKKKHGEVYVRADGKKVRRVKKNKDKGGSSSSSKEQELEVPSADEPVEDFDGDLSQHETGEGALLDADDDDIPAEGPIEAPHPIEDPTKEATVQEEEQPVDDQTEPFSTVPFGSAPAPVIGENTQSTSEDDGTITEGLLPPPRSEPEVIALELIAMPVQGPVPMVLLPAPAPVPVQVAAVAPMQAPTVAPPFDPRIPQLASLINPNVNPNIPQLVSLDAPQKTTRGPRSPALLKRASGTKQSLPITDRSLPDWKKEAAEAAMTAKSTPPTETVQKSVERAQHAVAGSMPAWRAQATAAAKNRSAVRPFMVQQSVDQANNAGVPAWKKKAAAAATAAAAKKQPDQPSDTKKVPEWKQKLLDRKKRMQEELERLQAEAAGVGATTAATAPVPEPAPMEGPVGPPAPSTQPSEASEVGEDVSEEEIIEEEIVEEIEKIIEEPLP